MTSAEREKLEGHIQQEILDTNAEILLLEKTIKPVEPDEAIGRLTRMEAIHSKNMSESNLRNARRKLSSLEMAATRVNSADYGKCDECGESIVYGRLLIMPDCRICVTCKEREYELEDSAS